MTCHIHFVILLCPQIQNNVTGYLQEAEWSHQNHKPRFIDHVNLTCRTVGAPTVCVSMMAGMSDAIMKQALEWTADVPYVVVAAGKIVRFMNDIAAFEVQSLSMLIYPCILLSSY